MNYFFEIHKVNNITMNKDSQSFRKKSRPTCSVPDCNKPAAQVVAKSHPDYPRYRRSNWIKELHPEVQDIWCCGSCHSKNTARVHGVKSAKHLTAKRLGMSVTRYSNRHHPYLWYRDKVPYCENIDGRLGFVCTFTGPTLEEKRNMQNVEEDYIGWLQVDHIDGNSDNNPPDGSNFQTLCACCHSIKTIQNKDYATIGRKRLKEQKNKRH